MKGGKTGLIIILGILGGGVIGALTAWTFTTPLIVYVIVCIIYLFIAWIKIADPKRGAVFLVAFLPSFMVTCLGVTHLRGRRIDSLGSAGLALIGKTRVPNLLGQTIEEALAKSKEAGIDVSEVRVDSLPLSELRKYSYALVNEGFTKISFSDTMAVFLSPTTQDTVILKAGRIFAQRPKPGIIVESKSRMAKVELIRAF